MASLSFMSMAREAIFLSSLTGFKTPICKLAIPTVLSRNNSIQRRPLSCQCSESLAAISDPKPGQLIRSPEVIALEYSDLNLPQSTSELFEVIALEYSDLNLPQSTSEEVGHVRIRQHVNPLSSSFSTPVEVPDWNEVFRDAKLPLMVDIGSGSGRFLMWHAKRNPNLKNYLGLEIRKKLAMRAESWADELGLKNIHYMFANATVSFEQLVSTYPGPLMLVSILCPDPHFKKKHHKRRVLQKPLVDSIVDSLAPGGQVFIQSDVLEVALDMRNHFDAESNKLAHIDNTESSDVCDDEGWLLSNPMGIRTEREIHAELEGAKIYRRMYQKLI